MFPQGLISYQVISVFPLCYHWYLSLVPCPHCCYAFNVYYLDSLFLILFFIFLSFFHCYSITVVPNFPFALLCPSHPNFHSQCPHRCPCPWVIHICSLSSTFPLFPPLSSVLPSGHCQPIQCFQAYGSILFIRSLL